MNPVAQLLMFVAEDLRSSDPTTYQALEEASRNGCATLVQIEVGPQGAVNTVAIGFRDDYGTTRWAHAMPLQ